MKNRLEGEIAIIVCLAISGILIAGWVLSGGVR
jgi:hypothetical protein